MMEVSILIVDDYQSNLDTLHYLIDDIEFDTLKLNIIEATNGNDALSIALKHDLALIILDIQMPDMDGFEVAKFLKKSSKTKDIPVVFLTAAFKSEQMREFGLHIGAYDYFFKPIDPLVLVPKIKLYINFYVIMTQLKNINKDLEKKVNDAVEKNTKMKEKLFEAEKLASMTEMVTNIAHQWRQPLSVISTSATGVILKSEYGMLDDKVLLESMNLIDQTAQDLSKTINDFDQFLATDTKSKTPFNLCEVLEQVIQMETTDFNQSNIKVVKNFQNCIEIKGFPNALKQAILNILKNCVDVLHEKSEKYIVIESKTVNEEIYITIKDNGGGVSQDIIHKIFEPYFTTKHQKEGIGLGLHISYNLVKNALGGFIDVKNEEFEIDGKKYQGALFTIIFPLAL